MGFLIKIYLHIMFLKNTLPSAFPIKLFNGGDHFLLNFIPPTSPPTHPVTNNDDTSKDKHNQNNHS